MLGQTVFEIRSSVFFWGGSGGSKFGFEDELEVREIRSRVLGVNFFKTKKTTDIFLFTYICNKVRCLSLVFEYVRRFNVRYKNTMFGKFEIRSC